MHEGQIAEMKTGEVGNNSYRNDDKDTITTSSTTNISDVVGDDDNNNFNNDDEDHDSRIKVIFLIIMKWMRVALV